MQDESSYSADQLLLRNKLSSLISGYRDLPLLYVAVKVGLIDMLSVNPCSVQALTSTSGVQERILLRILRGLVSADIIVETKEQVFALSPAGNYLRQDVPGSMKHLVLLHGEIYYKAWGALLHSVQTGETAFEHVFGVPFFHYLSLKTDIAAYFHEAMSTLAEEVAQGLITAYDFSTFSRVVDIGGGRGTMLVKILQAYPHLHGIVTENQQTASLAKQYIETLGLADRCQVITVDFFTNFLVEADLYILSQILHDWDDDQCSIVLRNCRQAMTVGTRLLVIERVVLERVKAVDRTVNADLAMFVLTGGQERTEEEFRQLFARASLRLTQVLSLTTKKYLIEAVAV